MPRTYRLPRETQTLNTTPRTLLAFDFGTRKIGVAAGQTLTATASPLPELRARDGQPDWEVLEKLVEEWGPDAFVLGLPYNMDGSESEMTRRARKFGKRLAGRFNRPVYSIDERLSSREARQAGRDQARAGGRRFDERSHVDSFAAQLILETWFAEHL